MEALVTLAFVTVLVGSAISAEFRIGVLLFFGTLALGFYCVLH